MTKIIGLTGGIGSGKTTVAKLFSEYGIPVYIADLEARNLMQSDLILKQIHNKFGDSVFINGVLLRDKLSEIVFNDTDKLKQLNEIVHPAVKKHFKNWLADNKNAPYVIYESAILFESGSYNEYDLIINVVAPLEIRIQRVIERDKTTREKVLERVKNQWNDEQKSSKSDFILENTSLEGVKLEIVKILKFLGINQIKS
ncbi:dephospho-CoA kinase [Flavobacterium sp. N3904]|uniref:dephospho-CoA kinase n=1 Tax=Flavobacterium sp. N3904 TaxID=2986835 RepID=UPI002224E57B|nr:dephospho-CoA kinase [Flavobacterium sp. N3904]